MTVEQAERIAQSQFVWAILFILLFMIVVGYLVRTSDKREKKLMDFHDQSKSESNKREEWLKGHLDKNTEQLQDISQTIGVVQKEMSYMSDRIGR
ncbi:TPA: hypothetical protein VBK33_002150, partial [Streptococcus agalactiae]|nr:hypothetical protein [Streptococcus agalactiae]HEM9297117.1 hypothetical protein [Streptococcus agalactiae]HEN0511970.1 hypothetical protein [Streptococcus agalactiae]HEN2413005.1 hypothetical protein [Streptococcus agalactiae]HEN2425416.1 hypothetical protein [Streptococcus agalactiae]